jgi:hypothetical protein
MSDRLKGWRLRRTVRGRRGARVARGSFSASPSIPLHATEAGAATAPAEAPTAVGTSLATLITRHILRDGEIILLLLKPSLWSIVFASMPALAVALIVIISTRLWAPHHAHIGIEAGLLLIAIRTGWAIMSWAGKLYLLTDLRIVRIWGVFNPQIHDIPLRKVARTRLTCGFRERLWRLGSIEIIPESDQWPWSVWQTIASPGRVHETIRRAVARAKQGGCHGSTW